MRRFSVLPLALTAALLLPAPAAVLAQDGPDPLLTCDIDCWRPAGEVARLDSLKATIDVTDGVIATHYRFGLSNPVGLTRDRNTPAEGRILLPVAPGSSVTDLVLSGGPETLEGRILGADEATRLYQEIVSRMVDPALLRSVGTDLYEVRAFPVPVGEERQVSFTVTTPLLAEGDLATVELPWSRMSPRPAAATVAVDVDVPWEVRSALAPGFDLATQRLGPGELGIGWESTAGWTPDSDFRLLLGGGQGLIATRLLAHRAEDEDGYFALMLAPVVEVEGAVARDVVLVLDVSGSMEGEKLEQAKAAAEYVLDHLGADDRFAIVDFSSFAMAYAEELRPATEAADGIAYVRDLQAGGDTNIAGALQRGLDLLDGERPGTVIFLTDGLPTSGIEDAGGIVEVAEQAAPDRTQLFAFGVGYDVDTVLLDSLSSTFVGSSHYVTPEERIDTEVQRLYERVSTPVLTDIAVRIEGVETSDVAPRGLTGIFAGDQALLTGRYEGSGPATVTLTGMSARGAETFTYEVDFPERDLADPVIAQLWAQRRVADLLTEVRIEGPRDSLIEEIVTLATRFGIVTPYTAYLAEEPDGAFASEADQQNLVRDAVMAAPSSGEAAVAGAGSVEDLRAGTLDLGGTDARVLGAHTYYRVDGTWTREGYEPGTDAPEVLVGSEAFLALIAADPALATAAALGDRVVTLGPDGWITIAWPERDAA
jgi:Ca-activated chloride channel family protein